LENQNLDRLVGCYQDVLGLKPLSRPNFGVGGSWLQLPRGVALRTIEQDSDKPTPTDGTNPNINQVQAPGRFIRRSRHVALKVVDIEGAKATLRAHSVTFAVNQVPDTTIEQLLLYDPDRNGIEIGNFDID
jgi:hypothetical protein